MNELLSLDGCTPEPLMGYLKTLGVLRLVSEQKDPEAGGFWADGVFKLSTTLDRNELVAFFRDEYQPTPLEDLIWGLSLIDRGQEWELPRAGGPAELPRAYAVTKLTLLPGRLRWASAPDGEAVLHLKRTSTDDDVPGIAVKPEPAIAAKLRAGDVQGACEIAVRRLRASGLSPIGSIRADGMARTIDWESGGVSAERLLAALLLPVPDYAVNQLADLVLRRPSAETLVERSIARA